MKNIIIALALLVSVQASAQIKSATLTASGLTCSMCSKSIYKALVKIPYVQSVDANVEKSSFAITFKEGSKVSFDDVKKAVQDAGFSVASLQAVISFSGQEIADDAHISLGGNTLHFVHVHSQQLTGDKTVTIIDKNFLPAKEYKKYGKYTTMKCFATGVKEDCCPRDKTTSNRVYHVTI